MQKRIRKAIFPVAGLGTRFLPATKASPKELLPIVDKPLIQYAVEEAIAAGVEQLIFVTNSNKRAIEDHFDRNLELEAYLEARGDEARLKIVRDILPPHISCVYVRQSEPKGLGHAVLCAQSLIQDEPFAVLLADDLLDSDSLPVLQQMIQVYEQTQGQVIAAASVPWEQVHQYGIIDGKQACPRIHQIEHLIEKPAREKAISNLAVIGRYILFPEIFEELKRIDSDHRGEIQLTDAIARSLGKVPSYAYEYDGTRYDCGSKVGYVQATLAYARKESLVDG